MHPNTVDKCYLEEEPIPRNHQTLTIFGNSTEFLWVRRVFLPCTTLPTGVTLKMQSVNFARALYITSCTDTRRSACWTENGFPTAETARWRDTDRNRERYTILSRHIMVKRHSEEVLHASDRVCVVPVQQRYANRPYITYSDAVR